VHRRLLRGRPATVNPRVAANQLILRDQVAVARGVELLVFGGQAARPGIGPVLKLVPGNLLPGRVLIPGVLPGSFAIGVKGRIRLLFGEQLVEGLLAFLRTRPDL
jgi:hypothetical protein